MSLLPRVELRKTQLKRSRTVVKNQFKIVNIDISNPYLTADKVYVWES